LILAVALVPVLLFLAALITLDSYKLVRFRLVLGLIAAGGVLAGLSYLIHAGIAAIVPIHAAAYARYVGPVVEECAKAALVVVLVRSQRVGFLVDAAICGFALGTGFGVVENVYYWSSLSGATFTLWLVRGFGTAVMHGGTTAIFAMAGKALSDAEGLPRGAGWTSALVLVIVIHSIYNHFFLTPVVSTALILVILPPLIYAIFRKSETALERWLNVGFDADSELLELILSGGLSETPVGIYLQSLKSHFRPEVVVDMLCYLRLHLELSLRAKGLLMMRESGFEVGLDPADTAKLEELDFLEGSIGRTGKLAMAPFLRESAKLRWQMSLLRG
jgi:RsiW-degrading membrane proteinase PrsW (M82 family)